MKTRTEIVNLCIKCLTRLRILRAFAPYASSRLTCLIHMSYRHALGVLFVNPKIFVGCICNPAKTFHFLKTIKSTTNRAVFISVKKQPQNNLSGEIFQAFAKRGISSILSYFSLYLFNHEVINFLYLSIYLSIYLNENNNECLDCSDLSFQKFTQVNLSLKLVIATNYWALKLIQNFLRNLCKNTNRKLQALA